MAATVIFAPIYFAAIAAYYVARGLGYSNFWLVDLTGYILPWVLLPALVFLPGALWRGSRLLLAAAGLPLLAFSVTYAPLAFPNLPARNIDQRFTLMTYNVFVRNVDYDSVLASIQTQNPDIVALQEVTDGLAYRLTADLGQTYPFQKVETRGPGQAFWGQAILSRFPIRDYRVVVLGGNDRPTLIQYALIEAPGGQLGLVNVHPHSPGLLIELSDTLPVIVPTGLLVDLRDRDMGEMMRAIEGWPNPLVLAGDFNLPDQNYWYSRIRERFIDAHREAGSGLGLTRTPHPGWDFPVWRIDFVFHTADMIAVRTSHGGFGGSDHRPVVAELAFSTTERSGLIQRPGTVED